MLLTPFVNRNFYISNFRSQICRLGRQKLLAILLVGLIALWLPHQKSTAQNTSTYVLRTDGGMVVSDSPIASRVGRNVIANGGNAVDAAVATAFALAVTWPEAGNIGGGGFMMIRPADGSDPVCVDYRETAPQLSKVNTFKVTDSTLTRKAVGVPGTVRGLKLAHEQYGKLPWKNLVQPAIELAKDGFIVDRPLANSINGVLGRTKNIGAFSELHRVYGKPDGTAWIAGDVIRLPELALTLAAIAEKGTAGFYQGSVADLLIKEMSLEDGLIRQIDLDKYQAKIRKPIVTQFNGYKVIGAPPPSSGGICLALSLNMIEELNLDPTKPHAPETIHLIAEVCRRAFLERARYLGDPDFAMIPDHLTSEVHAQKLIQTIKPDQATDSASLAKDIPLTRESEDTTHFSVVDPNGMAVSNTYTLEASWGSRIVVPGAGFVLNNEMGDFNWVKGLTNERGRIGTLPNLLAPGKRMLSSQCPIIITKDDQLHAVVGSPGGRTIINTVLGITLNHCFFGMSGPDAVWATRFHHQWMPDRLQLEEFGNDSYAEAIKGLEEMGHAIAKRPLQGSAHSIFIASDNQRIGVADPRRSGRAAGTDSRAISTWEFSGRRGQSIESTNDAQGSRSRWALLSGRAKLDGNDHLQLKTDAPEQTIDAQLSLDQPLPKSVSILVYLDGLHFQGDAKNEQFRIELVQNKNAGNSNLIASMLIERNAKNQIVLRGEGFGENATDTPAVQLSESDELKDRITIQLLINTESETYSIGMRNPAEISIRQVGTGRMGAARNLGAIKLRTCNDFSAAEEYLNVDRIEVRSAN